jgi:YVTN family beta-propeller protein/autotransporter-associated beta strand protein
MGHPPMRSRFAAARVMAGVLLLALCVPAAVQAQVTNRLFVPSQADPNVSVIDTATNTVIATPATGFGGADAVVSADGRRAYVVNSGAGAVAVYDLSTLAWLTSIVTTSSPYAIAITPDGRKAYVVTALDINVLDLVTNTVSGSITAGIEPWAVAVTPDGTHAYVTNATSNDVTIIDVATDTVIGVPIAVGNAPGGLAITPDGSTIYVANALDSTVSVILIDTVVATIPVGMFPLSIAITPDGTTAYVTTPGDNSVGVIDVATNTAGTPIVVGSHCGCPGTPTGLAITPDGQRVYVLSSDTDDVSTIDVATGTPSTTFIQVGAFPIGLGTLISPNLIVPDGGPLMVASDADLATRGFQAYVVFHGGTVQSSAAWSTSRTISMLTTGGTLDTHGFDTTLAGDIINEGTLTKTGAGRLILTGTSSNSGGTQIAGGTLEVNGAHQTGVTLTTGTLAGTGTLGLVIATSGGVISPGSGGPGLLHAVQVAMGATTTFAVDLNGTVPGTGYDRLESSTATLLGNATLSVHTNFVPAPGTSFVIATNTSGTFVGLAEGSVLVSDGRHFRITYHGGGGSDAALLADEPPAISGLSDQTVSSGSVFGPIAFTVSDDLAPAASLIVSATSSNLALLPNADLVLGGSGGTRTLKATPVLGASGMTLITVMVSDGVQTASASFTLTVTPLPVYYLSEGATGPFFDTDILLANPNDTPAPITVTFYKDEGTALIQHRTLPATSRTTIRVKEIDGLTAAAFSTAVTSTAGLPLVVERTMWWDASGYGAHGEKASTGASSQWYFAEGSQGFFHTFFLLLNPHEVATTAHITYFLEDGAPLVRDYALPATARVTVDVGSEPALANRSFGALVTFDLPGMAERAMYFGTSPTFSGGHDSAGVTAPATSWLLAEGATGEFFDTFVLVANPGDVDTTVTMTYLPATGSPIVKTHPVAAHQRLTVNIADEDPALASAAVGTQITAGQPVVVERSVYWPHAGWYEAHNTAGETSAGLKWGLAEGRVGGANHAQTYILLANPGSQAAGITATFLRTDGTTIVKTFTVAPSSRLNIAITGPGSDVPELADEFFGATIVSTQPIIVERSLYTDANGVVWAAGTNATGTRLP